MLSFKKIFVGLAIGGLGLCIFWVFLYRERFEFLHQGIAGYYAKELCSCLFVLEMEEDYCLDYTRYIVDLDNYRFNKEQKRVTTTFLGLDAEASYRGERVGCFLE